MLNYTSDAMWQIASNVPLKTHVSPVNMELMMQAIACNPLHRKTPQQLIRFTMRRDAIDMKIMYVWNIVQMSAKVVMRIGTALTAPNSTR